MLSEVDSKFVETVDSMREVAASDRRIKCLNEMVLNWKIAEWIKQCFSGKIEFRVLVCYQYGYLAIFSDLMITDVQEFGHFIDMALAAGGDDLSNEMLLNLHIVGLALAPIIYHPDLQGLDDMSVELAPALIKDPCQIIYMLRKVWEVLDKTPTLPELFVRDTIILRVV